MALRRLNMNITYWKYICAKSRHLIFAFLLLPVFAGIAAAHGVAEGDAGYIQNITGVYVLAAIKGVAAGSVNMALGFVSY